MVAGNYEIAVESVVFPIKFDRRYKLVAGNYEITVESVVFPIKFDRRCKKAY